jgi:hypothetical protein
MSRVTNHFHRDSVLRHTQCLADTNHLHILTRNSIQYQLTVSVSYLKAECHNHCSVHIDHVCSIVLFWTAALICYEFVTFLVIVKLNVHIQWEWRVIYIYIYCFFNLQRYIYIYVYIYNSLQSKKAKLVINDGLNYGCFCRRLPTVTAMNGQ